MTHAWKSQGTCTDPQGPADPLTLLRGLVCPLWPVKESVVVEARHCASRPRGPYVCGEPAVKYKAQRFAGGVMLILPRRP